jgi:hypothetical protein
MTTPEIIARARRAGMVLEVKNGGLHLGGHQSRLAPDLLEDIRGNKGQVIAWLTASAEWERTVEEVSVTWNAHQERHGEAPWLWEEQDDGLQAEVGEAIRTADLERARQVMTAWKEAWGALLAGDEARQQLLRTPSSLPSARKPRSRSGSQKTKSPPRANASPLGQAQKAVAEKVIPETVQAALKDVREKIGNVLAEDIKEQLGVTVEMTPQGVQKAAKKYLAAQRKKKAEAAKKKPPPLQEVLREWRDKFIRFTIDLDVILSDKANLGYIKKYHPYTAGIFLKAVADLKNRFELVEAELGQAGGGS